MLRNDYLMRMVQEITEAVMRALRLAREQKHEEAFEELRSAYLTLGLDPHLLELLDPPSILRMLSEHQHAAAVELFIGDAQLALNEGRTQHARRRIELARLVCTQGERGGAAWVDELNASARIQTLELALTESGPARS